MPSIKQPTERDYSSVALLAHGCFASLTHQQRGVLGYFVLLCTYCQRCVLIEWQHIARKYR